MIVIPSESGLQSRYHLASVDALQEHNEDDIHQCGACKQQFTDIFLFMRHKSESKCSARPGKKSTKVRVPTSLLTAGSSPPVNGSSTCTVRPEAKFTRVALLNLGTFNIQKDDILKNGLPLVLDRTLPTFSSSNPPPLVITNLGSHKLNIQNESFAKTDSDDTVLEGGWSSTRSAAKVLGLTNSSKVLQNQNFSVIGSREPGNIVGVASQNNNIYNQVKPLEQESLRSSVENSVLSIPDEDLLDDPIHFFDVSQDAEQFTRSPVLLDVDDEEVAALLGSHLTDEAAAVLQVHPNNSGAVLLDIPEITGSLPIINDGANEHQTAGGGVNSSKSNRSAHANKSNEKKLKPPKVPKPPRYYKCRREGCTFKAISARDLTRHQRKHTGEKPYKCSECEKAFTRPDKLRVHMKVHGDKNKPFQCEICDFSSRERGGLTVHMRKHTDERPFKCQLCDHSSRTKSHLIVHLRKHTGDHPFKCDICGKAFTTGSDLTRHSKTHYGDSGEKPFSCQHCSFSCNFKSSLKAHTELNHGPHVDLVCPICQLVCATRIDFRNHCKVHQDDPKYCNLCDTICSTTAALNKHLKQHSRKEKGSPLLNAKICSVSENSLASGVRKRTKKSPKRLIDDSVETLDIYNCTYCVESFYVEDALEEHIRQHQLEELAADPVLAFSADSLDSMDDSNSMDVTYGLADLAATSAFKQMPDLQSDDLHSGEMEILTSLNQNPVTMPQYVDEADQNILVDTFNSIQYVLSSPLDTLDGDGNDLSMLC